MWLRLRWSFKVKSVGSVIKPLQTLKFPIGQKLLAVVCLESGRFLMQSGVDRTAGVLVAATRAAASVARHRLPVVICLPHNVMQTVTIELPRWLSPFQRWSELSERTMATLGTSPDGLPWVIDAYSSAATSDGCTWLVGAVPQSVVDLARTRLQAFAVPFHGNELTVPCAGWSAVCLAVLPPVAQRDPSDVAGDIRMAHILDVYRRAPMQPKPWWHESQEPLSPISPEAVHCHLNFLPHRARARAAYRRRSVTAVVVCVTALLVSGGGVIGVRSHEAAARGVSAVAAVARADKIRHESQAQEVATREQRAAERDRATQRAQSLWRARAIDTLLSPPIQAVTYKQINSAVDGITVKGEAAELVIVLALMRRLDVRLASDTSAQLVYLAATPIDQNQQVNFEIKMRPVVSVGPTHEP